MLSRHGSPLIRRTNEDIGLSMELSGITHKDSMKISHRMVENQGFSGDGPPEVLLRGKEEMNPRHKEHSQTLHSLSRSDQRQFAQ